MAMRKVSTALFALLVLALSSSAIEYEQKGKSWCSRCSQMRKHPHTCTVTSPQLPPDPMPTTKWCDRCRNYIRLSIYKTKEHSCVAEAEREEAERKRAEAQRLRNIEGNGLIDSFNSLGYELVNLRKQLQLYYDRQAERKNKAVELQRKYDVYAGELKDGEEMTARMKEIQNDLAGSREVTSEEIDAGLDAVFEGLNELHQAGRMPGPAEYRSPPAYLEPNTGMADWYYHHPVAGHRIFSRPDFSPVPKSDAKIERMVFPEIHKPLSAGQPHFAVWPKQNTYSADDVDDCKSSVSKRKSDIDQLKMDIRQAMQDESASGSVISDLTAKIQRERELIMAKYKENDRIARDIQEGIAIYAIDLGRAMALDTMQIALETLEKKKSGLSSEFRAARKAAANFTCLTAAWTAMDLNEVLHNFVNPEGRVGNVLYKMEEAAESIASPGETVLTDADLVNHREKLQRDLHELINKHLWWFRTKTWVKTDD